jgi:hypothetical protein
MNQPNASYGRFKIVAGWRLARGSSFNCSTHPLCLVTSRHAVDWILSELGTTKATPQAWQSTRILCRMSSVRIHPAALKPCLPVDLRRPIL